jgi:UDP-glucose:(glucosyl)LPS alpha-1,2-glucosyltransferase
MSAIYKGNIIDTNLSRSAMGGTEQMRIRLLTNVDKSLLENVAIHFSRVRQIYTDVPNVFYAHDTADDPENKILENSGWKQFALFVFVSCWQRDSYIAKFGIPYSKCTVIENAIEPANTVNKSFDKIRLIYHTTPHRGLELLYPVYEKLSEEVSEKLHLDVFSSFEIYGWKERNKIYQPLFDKLSNHSHITYHGTQPNSVVREYLSNAHYFPYPCIWKETSCIALIEAIEHGVIPIHPNFGALPETAGSNSFMYDYTEDYNANASTLYAILKHLIDNNIHYSKIINKNSKHTIQSFTNKWTSILKVIQ